MKRAITIVCLIIGFLFAANTATFAQMEDDEENIDVGVGLVYGSQIESLGITADAYYAINNNLRVGGGLTYFFPEDTPGANVNWFSVDLNGHYFLYSEDQLDIYGLAGLNILIQSVNYDNNQFDDTSNSEVGLNIGGGVEYALDFADLFGELKLAGLGGDADQLVLGAGLRFNL